MSPDIIPVMDLIVDAATTWSSYLYKPISMFKAARMAVPWMISTRFSVTFPRVTKFLQDVRKDDSPSETTKLIIGAAGFCWGGKHAITLTHDREDVKDVLRGNEDNPVWLVDCSFVAHPSFLDIPKDIEAIHKPTSISVGSKDNQIQDAQVAEIRRQFDKGSDHEIHVEEGAKHGFSVRMHPEDEHEAACAVRAEKQALDWYSKHL
jgi:dienelactone hydrolase